MCWCCWALGIWVLLALGGAIFFGFVALKMRGEETEEGVTKTLQDRR
jgi:hypothetical protein